MVYTYTPTYYSSSSSFQETLTCLCKSILLPFSLKNLRRLPADQKMAKRQSDNLKWQQESFHKILNLIGLQKEGIVLQTEVSAFRSHLLDKLIASPKDQEQPGFVRDNLLFLQELFYAKCISADEYHSSKRPLLHRLAVQGVEIDCRDVVVGDSNNTSAVEEEEEEWSVIELGGKEEVPTAVAVEKTKTPIKSLFKWKGKGKVKGKKDQSSSTNEKTTNADNSSILIMPEAKRKPFRDLFDKEERDDSKSREKTKKQWGFDGIKKWKRSGILKEEEDESNLLYRERSEKDDILSVSCTLPDDDVGKMEKVRNEKNCGLEEGWVAFEESGDENHHPNISSFAADRWWLNEGCGEADGKSDGGCFVNNPFVDVDDHKNPFGVSKN